MEKHMKSVLVIGIGRFGRHLALNFLEQGNDVMVIDSNELRVESIAPLVTSAKIGDCTDVEVLKSLGIDNFDLIFVCIGTNFQSSLEITSLVKDMGGKNVISKATRDIQAKFLLRNGADNVIYPEKDVAERLAKRYSMNNVFDYMELTNGYGIFEFPPLKEWVGRTIRESNIAAKYKIQILGIKDQKGKSQIMPTANYIIKEEEHLIVLAKNETADYLVKKVGK
jgi:trk system potassium uptake protein TrkA